MPTYSDTEILKNRQAGAAESYGMTTPATATAGVAAEIAKLHTVYLSFDKAADDGVAATTTAETFTGRVMLPAGRIKSISYVATTGGITADAANNAVITVSKRDAAGINPLAVGTLTTNVALGNVVQGAAKAFTLTAANVITTANATFTFTIAKNGTGVVVRAGTFTIEIEKV